MARPPGQTAADIIKADGLDAAVDAFIRGHGGPGGRQAAVERLQQLFPAAGADSIEAVVSRAVTAVQGGRYFGDRADNYVLQPSRMGDAWSVLTRAGYRGETQYQYRAAVAIAFTDATGESKTVVLPIYVTSDDLLNLGELRDMVRAQALAAAQGYAITSDRFRQGTGFKIGEIDIEAAIRTRLP